MFKNLIILAILAVTVPLSLLAAGPGDEIVIVYNTRVPDSKGVAEYYAQRRQVPLKQVFGFALSTNEDMPRKEFRDSLQRPLAKALEHNKLWQLGSRTVPATNQLPARVEKRVISSKIRYAVLCYGVPLKIIADNELKEEGAQELREELRRNEAAVDSELALLPLIEENLALSGPLRNPVYTTTNTAMLHPTNGVLLVTRLDGPSAAIARGLIDKALEAETNGLWGRAYFDLRNTSEPGLKQGDEWIRGAAEICRRLGFDTVVDENPGTFPASFPMSQIAIYMGWYDGEVSGPFTQPTVEFMPGAFAYHLHSYSAGNVRSATQQWVGPLLAKGATATMGCVYEPYLGGTPDLTIFAARFIYYGFNFAEAAYAAQPVSSWQTTVVGDPLYRPFGRNPDQLHRELAAQHSKLMEWSYARLANVNLANGKSVSSVTSLLEELELTKQSALLTEKLGDLTLAQGKPSSAAHAYLQALKLNPSPQQRLRLRLTLGERLTALDRSSEAYDDYQQLLQENPHYPDKLSICRLLLALAQKLGKNSETDALEAEIARLSPPAPK